MERVNHSDKSQTWWVLLIFTLRSKNFAVNIKNKIKSLNLETQTVCLELLDYAMVECKMPLHTAVSSKDFISTLINLLKTRDAPEVTILIILGFWKDSLFDQKMGS